LNPKTGDNLTRLTFSANVVLTEDDCLSGAGTVLRNIHRFFLLMIAD
jgi:hypothetical protein